MILEQTVAINAWRVAPGVYRILLPLDWRVPFANVYLVESDGQYLLIDSGVQTDASLRALGRALKAIGVPARGLSAIVLTHRHPDHADGARDVQAHWGGRVLLHPDGMSWSRPGEEKMQRWAAAHGLAQTRFGSTRRKPPQPLPEDAQPLDPGRPLEVGALRLRAIHAPGHCPGQVMLHEAERGWLFTADQLTFPPETNVWYHADETDDPLGQYLESLEATRRIAADVVLPAHAAPLRGGPGESATAMLRFQQRFVAQVAQAVAAEPVSTLVVTERYLEGTGAAGEASYADLTEVLAALVHLERLGRVRQVAVGRWSKDPA